MKFFGVSVITIILILSVGYLLGVKFPGWGTGLFAKVQG